MDVIEFLQATKQKYIKNYIEMKIKEKVRECKGVLQERQHMLTNILEFESTQYNEELVHLIHERLNEQFAKRLQWLNTIGMERLKAEEELTKLKNQQRELEKCEEWRHFLSKQLLLNAKKAQLYQIEDKKLRTQEANEIDKMWQHIMEGVNREKEYQEIYETKLLKVMEGRNQLQNQKISEDKKKQQTLEQAKARKEFEDENKKTFVMEEKYHKNEKRRELLKREQYKQMLQSQIGNNCAKKTLETQLLLRRGCLEQEIEDEKCLREVEESERKQIRNKEWNKCYMKNYLKEKQQKLKEINEFEQMYSHGGCVIQQVVKNPYGTDTR